MTFHYINTYESNLYYFLYISYIIYILINVKPKKSMSK